MSTVVDEMVVKWSIDDSDYTKGLTKIDKDMKLVKSEFGATDSKLQAFGSTIDKLKNKQDYLTKTISLQEEKCKSLKDAYEKTKKETGENSEASQKLATKLNNAVKYYNKLQNELKQTANKLEEEEKELKKSESAWTKLSKSAEQANEKMSKSFEKIKGGLTKFGVAFSAITGVSAKFSIEYEKSLNKFQSITGASEDKLNEFADVIKNVYGDNFGESFEDVAESVGIVNKYLWQTGDELKHTTELAVGFRDSFGVDVSESIRSCKALMDNFGLSSDQAFNLMVQGEQNGLDFSGELIDTINEYSVQFAKVGFSAEDMFNILYDGTQSGAFNLDKIGDAVKEFSIRAIDGSNTTIDGFTKLGLNADEMAEKFAHGGSSARDAFYQVVDGIKNMNDPVQQSIVGVDLFGTMWEDLGPEVVTQLSTMSDAFNSTTSSADDLNNIQYNNLGDGLKGLWREIQTECLTPIETELMPKFNNIFELVKDKMPQIKDAVSGTVSLLANSIGFLVDNINWVIPVAKVALGVILSFKTINTVNKGIDTLTKSISNLKKGGEWVTTHFPKALQHVKNFGSGCANAAISVFTFAKNIALSTANLVKQGVQLVAAKVKLVAHKLATVASSLATKAFSVAQAALNFVMSLNPITLIIIGITALIAVIVVLYNKCDWFRNMLNGIFEWISQKFHVVDDFLTNIFTTDWSQSFGAIGEVMNVFCSVFKGIWDSVKEIFRGIIDFIAGVFTGDWSRAWEGVKEIFGGIMDGLGAVIKAPLNAVIGIINLVIDGLNTISVDIPDFIPGIGGEHFGVNIPKMNYLYKGGIIDSPTLLNSNTVVGDAYKGLGSQAEAVIPLDPMYDNLRNIVKEESGGQTILYTTNVFNVDGKELKRETTKEVINTIGRNARNHIKGKGGLAYV